MSTIRAIEEEKARIKELEEEKELKELIMKRKRMEFQESKKGKALSLIVSMTKSGIQELKALKSALKKHREEVEKRQAKEKPW